MIGDALIRAAAAFVAWILQFVPADPFGPLFAGFGRAWNTVVPLLNQMDYWLCVQLMISAFLLAIGLQGSRMLWWALTFFVPFSK